MKTLDTIDDRVYALIQFANKRAGYEKIKYNPEMTSQVLLQQISLLREEFLGINRYASINLSFALVNNSKLFIINTSLLYSKIIKQAINIVNNKFLYKKSKFPYSNIAFIRLTPALLASSFFILNVPSSLVLLT